MGDATVTPAQSPSDEQGTQMTDDVKKLDACPFCGGEGLTHRVPTGWRVSCKNCDCQPRPGWPPSTEAEAIAVWNRRLVVEDARPLPKWRCINCKHVTTGHLKPDRCPECKWCHGFAEVAEDARPPEPSAMAGQIRQFGGGIANQMRALGYQVVKSADTDFGEIWHMTAPGVTHTVYLAKDEAEGWEKASQHWHSFAVKQTLRPREPVDDGLEEAVRSCGTGRVFDSQAEFAVALRTELASRGLAVMPVLPRRNNTAGTGYRP